MVSVLTCVKFFGIPFGFYGAKINSDVLIIKRNMKANKTTNKEITKQYVTKKSMRNKDSIINLIVFTLIFFITVLLISQIV
ncbi:hypothetical protein D0817_12605 [Flavobacterium cupreum]|uniref:Uncharacterized protein n=1 Tax=Flavobacterium cupreum TaxID=2133766 RepID=A0A434A6K7_9FLAO|nr:hypothetical protein D0817_12605 [Flavobacterium cupreum]